MMRAPFSEDVRRNVAFALDGFVGEPATVQHLEPGRKNGGSVYKGYIAAVYANGFLLDGEEMSKREFFSFSDLFAQHARIIEGPAVFSMQNVLGRLRNTLAHDIRPNILRTDLRAVPA